ncbi:Ribosomal protein S9 signature [Nakaseomyces glabratus]|nr:Ribosomal protein S9 signature [Nakaseomyces glabratus]KAH7582822.1 Ribosomal protein S9 signature [Nakaseomyces glabratus]
MWMRVNRMLGNVSVRQFSNVRVVAQEYSMRVQQARNRIVPKSLTFYSANPLHEEKISRLESLLKKYALPSSQKLPGADISAEENLKQNPRPSWISFSDYALIGGGTRLKPRHYEHFIQLLNKLNNIDPQLVNTEIKNELSKYIKKSSIQSQKTQQKELDEFGRSVAIGKRKAATAKVYLVRGEGKILVNGRQLNDYFRKMKDRESIAYPLQVVDSLGKYNVFATCRGGGPTGQAEAIMHAIAKALLVFNPLLKPRLRKAGVITRDYRHVERKKPGKKKARKMPTWVKR